MGKQWYRYCAQMQVEFPYREVQPTHPPRIARIHRVPARSGGAVGADPGGGHLEPVGLQKQP